MLEKLQEAPDERVGEELGLGQRLKAIREATNLSQRELAKRANVSNATISLIEQNRTNPSVGLLKRILDGIPISLSEFFGEIEVAQPSYFFTAAELVEIGTDGISYRQVGHDLKGRSLQILHEHYAPGADTGEALLTHESQEGGVIIKGTLEVTVGDQTQTLGPGDTYYFDSRLPHRFRNISDVECEVVSACTLCERRLYWIHSTCFGGLWDRPRVKGPIRLGPRHRR